MSSVEIIPLPDPGLGNSGYLVNLGDGRALAVDVSRDLRTPYAEAQKRGLRIAFAADTHLHADFLSGARQLTVNDGARVLASAAGHREFAHTGLHDDDVIDLGGLRLRALLTPGHTHEHLSFLLLDEDEPVGVFTGGSLISGSAARTDLMSPEDTDWLTCAQYGSLHRLAELPDPTLVWPTHGAGSFCSAPTGAEHTSTIGSEKAKNPLLNVADEEAFAQSLLSSLGTFPEYFRRLGEINRRGPALLDGPPQLRGIDADSTAAMVGDGAMVVDVRPVADFAREHIPGALSNPVRPAFASWLGWLAPIDRPLILVRGHQQDAREAAWQAAKIGYDNLAFDLTGGMEAWISSGRRTASIPTTEPRDVATTRILDVRQRSEFLAGHLPGAVHVELGSLASTRAAELPDEPTLVMCGHGERAMSAASLLERAGHRQLTVLNGGSDEVARATGLIVETGE